MFINKEEYLAQRNTLLEAAQNLINEGKFQEFNAKKSEIEQLDNEFEEGTKVQANLNSLKGNAKITNIENKGVGVVAGTVIDSTNNIATDDMHASLEYRKAFMNHVVKGAPIPGEFLNADATTKTTDIGTAIPLTIMEKIIEKLVATGMVLSEVTRTSYKGGVSIPTSSVKPVASWVVQGAGSDKQKKTTGQITFAYHKLRCAVAVTIETDVTSLDVFETTIINNVTEAMVKAIEQAIINGTGDGQPEGILTKTPPTGQTLDVTELTYKTLTDAEGALPLEYETDACYCMTKKTFMAFMGITDTTGQPIARVNYGVNGKPERTLLGRPVMLCNYMENYSSTLEVGKPFAFIFNFKDYVLNTNFNMGIKKYEDYNTDDLVTKSVMLVDGKVVDVNSLVVLKKKA
jgi:HK97 family phage major capsid protein